MRNRWHVFEYMKQRYMRTGVKPTRNEVLNQFKDTDFEEIVEGIAEFNLVVKHLPRGIADGRSTKSTAS